MTEHHIIHLDMDAFYPAVEILDNPELRGKPVIVGGLSDRGVVSSASYEARKFGVHSAQPMVTARRLCPKGVFLPVRMERYREMSAQVFHTFHHFTPLVEPLSIDEAFLDVTGSIRLFGEPAVIARKIKAMIHAETGLIASAGVAPSKFVAKIASDLDKPDGLTVVGPDEVRAFLNPLPIEKMWGAGKVTRETLERLGVRTFRDLSRISVRILAQRFGKQGIKMHELSLGLDDRKVEPDREITPLVAEFERFSENGYMDYLKRVCRKDSDFLQIMYGVGGELQLDEEILPHLEGYRRSAPVRIGNGAAEQIQMDVYGEVMDSIHIWRRRRPMTEGMWELVVRLADWVASNWRRPDSGPWEVRTEPRHFVFSKLMCWVALDRAVRAAEEVGTESPLVSSSKAEIQRWRVERDQLRTDILEHGWNEEVGAFVQSYGSTDLDAANLVIPFVRFLPADDPRVVSTVERIRRPLEEGGLSDARTGLVYRYRSADGLSDAGEGEGTFAVNTFQLAQVLALQGRIDEAVEIFESVLERASPTGLIAEEIDPATGELLGNYPQAYSHIGLINAAHVISRLRRETEPTDALLPENGEG
ncbi:MAG: DNA polymerase IV [Gemmatimonadota bacterium]